MKTRKARRLEKLRITSVDTVPAGAGENCRIVLAKSVGRYSFNDADSLVRAVRKPKAQKRAAKRVSAKAAAKAATTKSLLLKLQRIEPLEEELPTMPTTIEKAVSDMSARCAEIMKANPGIRTTSSAIAKVAVSPLPADRDLWTRYKLNSVVEETPIEEAAPAQSDAYEALMVKAEALANREGLSVPTAFAKVYADPANRALVQADKAAAFAKMTGQTEPGEPVARPSSSRAIIDSEIADHLRKSATLDAEAVAKATTAATLHANLMAALRASYPTFSNDRLESIARQLAQKMPDLDRLGRDRGYRGSAA